MNMGFVPLHKKEKIIVFFTNLVSNTANESTLGTREEEEEEEEEEILDVSHTQQNPPPLLSRVNESVCFSLSVYFYC